MTVRLLKGTVNTVSVIFYIDETPTDADGDITVTVTDYFGEAVATGTATSTSEDGEYTFEIPAQGTVKILRVTWSGVFQGDAQEVIQEYEIVGSFLFSLAELRAQDGLDDDTVYPTTALATVRDDVTDLVNEVTGTAFGEAWWYMRTPTRGRDIVVTRVPLRSVISVGSYDSSGWYFSSGGIIEATEYVDRDTLVQYSYGRPNVPGDLRRAALRLARQWLLDSRSSIPDRARQLITPVGTYQLTYASKDEFPTGIPEVDSVLHRYTDVTRRYGFA